MRLNFTRANALTSLCDSTTSLFTPHSQFRTCSSAAPFRAFRREQAPALRFLILAERGLHPEGTSSTPWISSAKRISLATPLVPHFALAGRRGAVPYGLFLVLNFQLSTFNFQLAQPRSAPKFCILHFAFKNASNGGFFVFPLDILFNL